MENKNFNIEKIIESKIKIQLFETSPPEVEEKIMEKVELAEKFQIEDVKANRLVKKITLFVIGFLGLITLVISYFLIQPAEETVQKTIIDNIFIDINNTGLRFLEILGFKFSFEYFFYGAIILILVILFGSLDRIIIKRAPSKFQK